ncbi:hypothetical protein [Kineosporia sp. NBRC 101731]|uniref:hypothetical protein n=1 Tax=Kineosporia sp. NBRC 101731 TaxID=3032199 RepID=UPI0024A3D347|nr:hypothetical protein [Kineosporia sp. NBRC 101731]GLY33274.1 hypothetical protein Kisp02_66390 [Kineosporia sp. NBRC 101731]
MIFIIVCLFVTAVAVGTVISLYRRDARNSRRISDEGSEFLETFETAPPQRSRED